MVAVGVDRAVELVFLEPSAGSDVDVDGNANDLDDVANDVVVDGNGNDFDVVG